MFLYMLSSDSDFRSREPVYSRSVVSGNDQSLMGLGFVLYASCRNKNVFFLSLWIWLVKHEAVATRHQATSSLKRYKTFFSCRSCSPAEVNSDRMAFCSIPKGSSKSTTHWMKQTLNFKVVSLKSKRNNIRK